VQLPPDISYRIVSLGELPRSGWEMLLSEEELERLAHFGSMQRKRQFLAGRIAARTLLAGRLAVPPAEVPLTVATDGAVDVDGTPFHVSISHAGEYAVAAIALRPVGVDIERVVPRHPDLHRRFLNDAERTHLDELNLDRDHAYILSWAIKEAVLKGRRTGFRCSPKRLNLTICPAEQSAMVRVEGEKPWSTSFEWIDGYCLAIAFQQAWL